MEEIKVKSNKCSLHCFQPYWEWIIQVLIWLEIPALIYGCMEEELLHLPFWTGLIVYSIYIITMFCSPTFAYLRNLNTNQTISEKLEEYFQAAPAITFRATCFHYETKNIKTTDRKGKVQHHIEQVKVITRSTSQQMRFYSSKDLSGLFLLDLGKGFYIRKAFVKLNIENEINFSDSVSYADYLAQKEAFWKENRFCDTHMEFTETRTIPGMENYNLIRIDEYQPYCVSIGLFIFFVFFPFAQLYKIYIDSLSVSQKYTIMKVVSTRYNLLSDEFSEKFKMLHPALNLNNQLNVVPIRDTGVVNSYMRVSPVSQEDINSSLQYEKYIPKFELAQDANKKLIDIDYNLPPPSFEMIPGDIAIPNDQLILPGQEPMLDINQFKSKNKMVDDEDYNIIPDNKKKYNANDNNYDSPLLG